MRSVYYSLPVGALRERDDTEKVWDAIADDKKVVVAQVAPAVRAAWGEALGLSREEATVGKIMDALKKWVLTMYSIPPSQQTLLLWKKEMNSCRDLQKAN